MSTTINASNLVKPIRQNSGDEFTYAAHMVNTHVKEVERLANAARLVNSPGLYHFL